MLKIHKNVAFMAHKWSIYKLLEFICFLNNFSNLYLNVEISFRGQIKKIIEKKITFICSLMLNSFKIIVNLS